MKILQGKGACGAVAIGTISLYRRKETVVKRESVSDTDYQKKRFHAAREKAIRQLVRLYDTSIPEIGETNARIFEIHRMMLEDSDFLESVEHIIESQRTNAEYAATVAADNFALMFSSMEDAYMKERAADVKDISDRLLLCFNEAEESDCRQEENLVICADDLAPSETVRLDKSRVAAFVTRHGSQNSHTAILARTMNIPAVVGVGEAFPSAFQGKTVIVDGYTGTVYVDPDEETLQTMQKKQAEDEKNKALLEELKGKENVTLDGKTIQIYANIGGLSDVGAVLLHDAGGIGLFRSEFLYLERESLPTEEEQFAVYKKVLESMAQKKVIIRTMDIGADKQLSYLNMEPEENPALGYRAIRICLAEPDIFKTQLRALLRASVYGTLSIMFPMIVSEKEVFRIKEMLEHVKNELKGEGIPYREDVEIGIMIETPAAAIISDILAPEVDFFSVGTNDLVQYTLAADRQNPKLDSAVDSHHEAVMRLIAFSAENAHKYGKWIGICGELAADTTLTERFLQMGIDELSVSPTHILRVRDSVRKSHAKKS